MATSSHGQNLAIPSFAITGMTSRTVTGLNPGTTYYFIVRAKDAEGNIDNNTVERSATTQAPPPPQMADLYPTVISFAWDYITFNVNNSGTLPANNVRVVVLVDDTFNGLCSSFVVSVPAGSFVTLTANQYYYDVGYRIWVDPNNSIAESNELNNEVCYLTYCTPPSISICP